MPDNGILVIGDVIITFGYHNIIKYRFYLLGELHLGFLPLSRLLSFLSSLSTNATTAHPQDSRPLHLHEINIQLHVYRIPF